MRDKTHTEFVEKWAKFVRDNPNKWQEPHAKLIDSQILMNRDFLKRLSKEKNGREKIIKLYSIKNIAGYKKLLG